MKSTKTALTGGISGSMTVKRVSFLSEDGGGTGMAGDGAEDCTRGLGTATLLK